MGTVTSRVLKILALVLVVTLIWFIIGLLPRYLANQPTPSPTSGPTFSPTAFPTLVQGMYSNNVVMLPPADGLDCPPGKRCMRFCQGNADCTVRCNAGSKKILVHAGKYGNTHCNGQAEMTMICTTAPTQAAIQGLCNNQPVCTFPVADWSLCANHDPASGCIKQAWVEYECI